MSEVDEHGRLRPPVDGGEVDTLVGFLDWQRATLEWKCRDLGAAQLDTRVAASTMTLGGILKHVARVEHRWFTRTLHDLAPPAPWDDPVLAEDRDWPWRSAAQDRPEDLRALWDDAVATSRRRVAEFLASDGLDQPAKGRPAWWPRESPPSLRWILVHMIEEYARHNGHADLLREAIDGQTGE